MFNKVLLPGFEWNFKLQEHYKQSKVRKVLTQIKNSSAVDANYKEIIDEILSGVAWKHIQETRTGRF
jgi:hypothetical protein